ncbi:hypothetical protein DOY81_013570, partial [Sarcophaga bullata]
MKSTTKPAFDQSKPNSCAFFKPHWLCWKILGISQNIRNDHTCSTKYGYIVYSILLNLTVTVFYPLHLALHLFRSDSMADNIKNFAVCVTCVACSLKFIIYSTKMVTIEKFETILQLYIGLLFVSVYLSVGITAELSFIFRELERSIVSGFGSIRLDHQQHGLMGQVYQIVAQIFLLLENFVEIAFHRWPCVMPVLKILSIRVSNIGYDSRTLEENERELNRCVVDQMTLYDDFQFLFDQLHRSIFASNWTNQSIKYKKHMMLFTERSLKQNAAMAGGMVRIHLD